MSNARRTLPESQAVVQTNTAKRILPILRDLERRATDADMRMLAYLIDLALIEAARAAKATDAT